MGKNILFSIVVPTYNRATILTKTIQSVLDQTYEKFELIVVDDGSTDNTKEIVSAFLDKKVAYYKKENSERGAARNFGARIAKGKYVNFFDSDDLLYTHHLKEAVSLAKQDHEIFHLGYDIKNPDGTLIKKVDNLNHQTGKQLIRGNFLSCNGVFIRRDIALKNPFSEDRKLSALEDWELWLRLASRFDIKFSNQITSTVVNHEGRSVLDVDNEALITRVHVLISSICKDSKFVEVFGEKIHILKASLYTYISLHLAISRGDKKTIFKYLIKGILNNPFEVFRKRFFVVIKKIIPFN